MLKRPRPAFAQGNQRPLKRIMGGTFLTRPRNVNAGFKNSNLTLAAIRNQNAVHHRSGEEVKAVDTELAVTYNNAAGNSQVCLNIVVQGAAFYNRIGTRIKMKSLHLVGFIQPSLANGTATVWDYSRILIYYDRQPGTAGAGAFPAVANLLLDYAQGSATTTNNFSGLNLLLRDRYQIIRDIRRVLPPLGISGVASVDAPINAFAPGGTEGRFEINEFIRLGEMETHYNQTNGGTIGDITTGSLNVLFINGNASTAWQFTGAARLRYIDT